MLRDFKILFAAILATVSILFSGCGVSGNEGANDVGSNLVRADALDNLDATTVLGIIQSGIDPNATNAFSYKAIKITYKTQDMKGDEINASGLLVIPTPTDAFKAYLKSIGKTFSLSAVCENHGTIFTDAEAPTNVQKTNHYYLTALLYSGYAGFVSIIPDYIGYGESKGHTHPYILKSSAQASLDMIKASVRYMTDNNILFNGQLFLSGYSEGGYVAMALAEKIEEDHSDEFHLMGVAPMAGPYDVEALADYDLNASMKMVYPAFLAFIADSYSKTYDDIDLSNIVVRPDVFESVDLFGGDYDTFAIHTYLGLADIPNGDYGFYTHYTNELFKDSFIDDFHTNVNNPARVRFAENSVYDWLPKTKVNLIQCLDDDIIPFKVSTFIAYNAMKEKGADVLLSAISTDVIPPASATKPFIHQRCAAVAYGIATKWFDKLRSGE